VTTPSPTRLRAVCLAVLFLEGCSHFSILRPAPEGIRPDTSVSTQVEPVDSIPIDNDLDFASAFSAPPWSDTSGESFVDTAQTPDAWNGINDTGMLAHAASEPSPFLNTVRIALGRNLKRAVFYTVDTMVLCAPNSGAVRRGAGRVLIEAGGRRENMVVIRTARLTRLAMMLPCTLRACVRPNYFEYGEKNYRGSVILSADGDNSFSVINALDVEEYLRGVLPLELGKRTLKELEAVKAQAVAARTYTYRMMRDHAGQSFDMLPTVSDQVYGGVSVEQPLCDIALKSTRGMVLVYGDSLISAYYHSTCGGMTARADEVWRKAPQPYLRSIRDVDSRGKPYCSISPQCTWEEKWSGSQFSALLARYGRATFPETMQFTGMITGMAVTSRYACGRVAACRIESTTGSVVYGGDKIRFALRRFTEGNPILRSANFTVMNAGRKEVVIQGRGYGHGVGMCQMGAIGRARQGQKFDEILTAYYPGTRIVCIPAAVAQAHKKDDGGF
jgi:stage II sporulation protein D